MSGEIIDFVARLSAVKLGQKEAYPSEFTPNGSALQPRVEGKGREIGALDGVVLADLQSALVELRAELVIKQAQLLTEGIDLSKALFIGAQADAIMRKLAKLSEAIASLKYGA